MVECRYFDFFSTTFFYSCYSLIIPFYPFMRYVLADSPPDLAKTP